MKKKIKSFVCIILVLCLFVPTMAFAQNGSDTSLSEKIINKHNTVIDASSELMNLRKEAGSIIGEIKNQLASVKGIKKILDDPKYAQIKVEIEIALKSFKDLDVKVNFRQKFEEFKKQKDTNDLLAADTTVATVLATQQEKINAIKVIIANLKATLEKVKAFVAEYKDKVAEFKAYKDAVENIKKTIQANHLKIVKAEVEFRQVNNTIIATITSNKDIFTDEKLKELEAVLVELKALKDDLHKYLKNGVREAIQTANKLRIEGKYLEAKASLEIAIELQNTKLLALGEAKVKAEKILEEINAIIAETTPVSSSVSSSSSVA